MFSYNEKCIMNLADGYTLLYGYIVKNVLDRFGEAGEKAVREGTRRYGRDRAMVSRQKHLEANAKINMENLFSLYHDLPGDPRFRREKQRLNPQERVSHTLICPMADLWKEHGQMAIGRIYCEEFHPACYSTYAYGYTQVNLAKTLTQEGDEYCAFNVVLRPENLPPDLKPLCFEEYDFNYQKPQFPQVDISAKQGFTLLSTKLYFYLLDEITAQLGNEGEKAVERGLLDLAAALAKLLKDSAAEYGRELDEAYIEDNVPLTLKAAFDEMWAPYEGQGAKQRLERYFFPELYRLLGISKR